MASSGNNLGPEPYVYVASKALVVDTVHATVLAITTAVELKCRHYDQVVLLDNTTDTVEAIGTYQLQVVDLKYGICTDSGMKYLL